MAEELRAVLARKQVSRRDLADEADVAYETLGKILRGAATIDVEQLYRICAALGVEVFDVVAAAERSIEPARGADVVEGRFGGVPAAAKYSLDAAALESPVSHHDEDVSFEEQP